MDCGCSIVGQTRIKSFEIMNYGGEGRFWMLTEREFYKEVRGTEIILIFVDLIRFSNPVLLVFRNP